MQNNGAKLKFLRDRIRGHWAWRIIGQLQFAYKLSQVKDNQYDSLIEKALDFIMDNYNDGKITQEVAQKAENMISDLAAEAKKYKVMFVAHAHIDMNWMWRWDETVSITLDTFRTMLNLMEEYPDFKFSQSQASVYKIVEEHAPEMLKEIKKRVKENRWEVTASTWVEADKNIPNGESMARHLLYTKKYLSKLLEIDPDDLTIDFEPDTFGHSRNVPEVLNQGGVKYYYHCRGFEDEALYRWQAPSGESVIVFRDPHWYNSQINPDIATYVPGFCQRYNVDTLLHVYGVGDHGGGPTRRDLERIIDMSNWPVFPVVEFGTMKEYFSRIDQDTTKLPVVDHELNFIFTGCYTSQSRIKKANRFGENALNEAEFYNTNSALLDAYQYQAGDFARAWQNVLFNQFHDIIPGSGVIDTREYAMGLFQQTMATTQSKKKLALEGISSNIDTSRFFTNEKIDKEGTAEGAGVGFGVEEFKIAQSSRGQGKTRVFHIFNSALIDRQGLAEIVIWDWQGDTDRMLFTDDQGNTLNYQLLDQGFNNYWGHKYLKVLVELSVPAGGYTTCLLKEADTYDFETPKPLSPRTVKPDRFMLENDFVRVVFDSQNAAITSLFDKVNQTELVDENMTPGIFRLIEEDDSKGMTSWKVGRYQKVESLTDGVKIKKINQDNAVLRQAIKIEVEFRNSKIEAEIYLDKNSPCLNYNVTCDWQEAGKKGKYIPQLGFYLPLAYECQTYKYDIPFGTIEREGMDMDVPANSWVVGQCKPDKGKSVMLITDSKSGFRGQDNKLSVTLIRGSYDPDPYPELGIHRFKFAISLVDNKSNRELIDLAYDYHHPLTVISGSNNQGNLPTGNSLFKLLKGDVAISAIKMPENNEEQNSVILRVYETEGEETEVVLACFKEISDAYFVDVNESKIEVDESIKLKGTEVSFNVRADSVCNICLKINE